ncbi:MAG: XdhC family protein [Candidatus Adiutrix sp.]|jgi:xanthine dehydrogenase accessory factor|nr:XdhC family protein [Candidatus Adiutrix sp.]
MSDIYQQLLRKILDGRSAVLVSEYRPAGIRKYLDEGPAAREGEAGPDRGGLVFSQNNGAISLREHFVPRPRLIVLGGGHIALPLAAFGAGCGFQVIVYDDRPSFANPARFPDARAVICDGFDRLGDRLNFRPNDYVVVATRGHRHDLLCLKALLKNFPGYVGMVGSKSRTAVIKKQLAGESGAEAHLARLHSPVGLDLGAVTPEEIAVSILAELIAHRRGGPAGTSGGAGRPSPGGPGHDPDIEALKWLAENPGEESALVTVVATRGSCPREAGARMVVRPYGQIIGSIGGGCAEAAVIRQALAVIGGGAYDLLEIDLTDSAEEDGMVCGGLMKVLLEAVPGRA